MIYAWSGSSKYKFDCACATRVAYERNQTQMNVLVKLQHNYVSSIWKTCEHVKLEFNSGSTSLQGI